MSQRSKITGTPKRASLFRAGSIARNFQFLLATSVALLALADTASAEITANDPPFAPGACAWERRPSSPGTLGCTSNDIQIAEVNVTQINGDPNATTCINGQLVQATIQLALQLNSTSRYDVGVYVALDGGSPTVATGASASPSGSCAVSSVAIPPGADLDGDTGDTCGDFSSAQALIESELTTITIPCTADANGNLAISAAVTWQQGEGEVCSNENDVYPGTTAKCNASVFSTPIQVVELGHITVTKETNPAGGQGFNFTTTGIPAVGADPGQPVTTPEPFPLDDGGVKELEVGTVAPGGSTYTITEAPSGNFNLSNVACTLEGGGGLPAGVFSRNGNTITLNLSLGVSDINCTFTNTEGGSLTVSKTVVEGNPAGGLVAGSDFPMVVNCGAPDAFTLENGANNAILNIANGTVCTVSEVSTGFPAPNPGYVYDTPPVINLTGATAEACTTPPGDALVCTQFTLLAGATVGAEVVNTLIAQPATLTVTKDVTGNETGFDTATTFPITVNCGSDVTFTLTDGQSNGPTNVTAGSVCTVSEDSFPASAGGYTFTDVSINVTGVTATPCATGVVCTQFTAEAGVAIGVTITNIRTADDGDVAQIAKAALTGNTAGYDTASLFGITVDCGAEGNFTANLTAPGATANPPVIPGIATFPLTTCTVTETYPSDLAGFDFGNATVAITFTGGAGGTTVNCTLPDSNGTGGAPCTFQVPPGASATVTVTNTRIATDGSVVITKDATGPGVVPGSTFSITIDCGAGGTVTNAVLDGGQVTLQGVTAGSTCLVSEGALPAALPGFSYGTVTAALSASQSACVGPQGSVVCQQFTMPAGGQVTGTITNPTAANPGNVESITKTVTGQTAGYVGGSTFAITVNCNGNQVVANLANGASQAGPQAVPAGTQCTASEAAPPAAAAGYLYGTPTITITGGVSTPVVCNSAGPCNFTMPPGGSVAVAVSNPLSAGPGQVTSFSKTVVGARAGLIPGTLFHFTLTCGNIVFGFDLADLGNGGGPGDIPAGTVCTIVEDSPPNPLQGFFFSGSSFTITGAVGTPCTVPQGFACRQFTVGAGANITIAGVNTLVAAEPIQAIPTLGRNELLALMLLVLGFGLVAVPRYLRNRG